MVSKSKHNSLLLSSSINQSSVKLSNGRQTHLYSVHLMERRVADVDSLYYRIDSVLCKELSAVKAVTSRLYNLIFSHINQEVNNK